jgi:hypothetical protein
LRWAEGLSGRGGSSWNAICITASTVQVGFLLLVSMAVSRVLGASVDIPTSFSRCSISSVGTVWITALAVQVGMVWVLESIVTLVIGFVCTPSLIRASSFSSLLVQLSSLALHHLSALSHTLLFLPQSMVWFPVAVALHSGPLLVPNLLRDLIA